MKIRVKLSDIVDDIARSLGKALGFLVVFFPAFLYINYSGGMELFDFQPLNLKQVIGISVLAAYVAS